MFQGRRTDIRYAYDGLYRLTDANYSGNIGAGYVAHYDAVGNITDQIETFGKGTTTTTRTCNAANQLISAESNQDGIISFA